MDFDEIDYLEKTVENPEVDETVKPKDNGHSRSSKHKSDERRGHDLDHRSKHAKYGDDGYDHDRQRERSMSRHHRSSSKDRDRGESDKHWSNREHKERYRDNGREERNGRGREREREQGRGRRHDRKEQNCETERELEKERKERDHEGHRERNKEREIERDRENEHSRRSKSHSERYSSRNDRDREKELKEKENERELKERESRRYKEKKDDVAEPEADPERDQRTVFAYQISLKADERDVYEFFSRAGKVRDVRLIMDRNSRRSKGVGYIEFYDAMSVPMAIALSGQPLLSQPVMVKPSEAEKNLAQSTTSAAGGPAGVVGPYSGGARRLYVGNLHFNITEDQLRQVFEPFGTVELVQLPLDLETGQCKGFGFIQFARLEDARAAQSLNGQLDIAGRIIKVSAITDQAGMQDVGANAADFDDDEGGGLSLNARSRAVLMQKLDRTGVASSIAGPLGNSVSSAAPPLPPAPLLGATPMVSPLVAPLVQASLPALGGLPAAGLSIPATVPTFDTVGVPSECLLLKNMFDPSLETEPDFDLDIKEDVEDECKRFGKLKHIHVDKSFLLFFYYVHQTTCSAIQS